MKRNENSDEQIRNNLMYECILKLIKLYYLHIPETITEVKLNVDNLIPVDFQQSQSGLQLNMLELLLLIAKSSCTINSGKFFYLLSFFFPRNLRTLLLGYTFRYNH